jgi:hypothetical protein
MLNCKDISPPCSLKPAFTVRFFRRRFAVLLCLDGNFDHQRLKHAGSGDQPVPWAFTYFVSPNEVAAAKQLTEQAMGKQKRPSTDNEAMDPDATIPGLSLPEHVYSGCEKRFFAADEDNKKGETSVFSDTGLMAMVCRHDRVLFMANLKDPGEKRYYSLALLTRLFQELPASWTAGVLYDIGCQLHRTITKVCFHCYLCHPSHFLFFPAQFGPWLLFPDWMGSFCFPCFWP